MTLWCPAICRNRSSSVVFPTPPCPDIASIKNGGRGEVKAFSNNASCSARPRKPRRRSLPEDPGKLVNQTYIYLSCCGFGKAKLWSIDNYSPSCMNCNRALSLSRANGHCDVIYPAQRRVALERDFVSGSTYGRLESAIAEGSIQCPNPCYGASPISSRRLQRATGQRLWPKSKLPKRKAQAFSCALDLWYHYSAYAGCGCGTLATLSPD